MSGIKAIKWRRWFGRIFTLMILIWLLVVGGLIALIHHTGTIDQAQSVDVIIVLGAGLTRSGRPDWALTRRSTHAADLWHQGYADRIICTGGVGLNQTRSEADGCREVLERNGVPASAIILEENSHSTEENAIFCQQIMQASDWQTALLVSDSYHVFRARYIFTSLGVPVFLSPVPAERIGSAPSYALSILREVAALHWQVIKDFLNIPINHIPVL